MKKNRRKKRKKEKFIKSSFLINFQKRRWRPWALSPTQSVFLLPGRSRGITWSKETEFIRVLMLGEFVDHNQGGF